MTWLKYQRFCCVPHAQGPEVKPLLTLAFHAFLHNSSTATEPEGLNATSNKVPPPASDWMALKNINKKVHASCYPPLSPTVSTRVALFLFTLSLLPESANLIHLKALVLHCFLLFSKCGLFPITPHLIAQAGEGASAPAALIKMLMHLKGNISLAEQKGAWGWEKKCVIKHLPFSFCKCFLWKCRTFRCFRGGF